MKTTIRIRALLIATSLSLFAGCVGEMGSGDLLIEEREAGEFDRVVVSGGGIDMVEVIVCDCTSLKVSGDDNLIDRVETKVSAGTLEIDTDGWFTTVQELRVQVRTPSLDLVSVSGSANLRVLDLRGGDLSIETSGSSDVEMQGNLDSLSFDTSGSSDIDVKRLIAAHLSITTSGSSDLELFGETDILDISTSGSSDINARELTAREVTVTTSGSSDVAVCATETLTIETSGSSDVDYYCDPEVVNKSTSGSSDVVAH